MSQYQIELKTRDGQRIAFACGENENLISAAARASILLPSVCKSGGCGACRASHEAGAHIHDAHSREALSGEAKARGEVLLCRTRPQADMRLNTPFDHARVTFGSIPERWAQVLENSDLGGDTRRLVLQLEDDAEFGAAAEFEPGQYVELTTPESDSAASVTRAYSLANTANWDGRLEFLIHLQPAGAFSNYLAQQAAPGQRLKVRGPQGAFVLQQDSMRPRVFVAGGTGLAPMLSMLRRMAEYQDSTPAALFFGVGSEAQLFGADDIAAVHAELPQLQTQTSVWKASPSWSGQRGTPVDALSAYLANAGQSPDIYLCGPAAMIEAAEKAALAAGVPATQIFSERFLPS